MTLENNLPPGAKTADRGGHHLNVILTAVPRSGTTLVCALLNRVPSVVALHEPMSLGEWALRMTREMVIHEIDHFLAKARNSLMRRGVAPSRQVDAQVPSNPFSDQKDVSGVRHAHGTPGVLAGHGLVAGFRPCRQTYRRFCRLA
jgi:hypothetical protein